MRVASDTRLLEVDPGGTSSVVVDVVNNGEVIDGVTAHIIGMPDEFVTANPALLPLFPDASGQVTLALAVPQSHPAGRHPLTVEVVSHGTHQPSQFLDVDLDVAARPSMHLIAKPRVIRARRSGRFVFELSNDGNIPLDVELSATDPDRAVQTTLLPERLRLEPGVIAPVLLAARGPRMFTGADVDRSLTVDAIGTPCPVSFAEPLEQQTPLTCSAPVRLRQRPTISRGLLTALILMSIVGLWAAAFLLGLSKVFAGDPMTKEAPASFFAANAAAASTGSGSGTGSGGGGAGSTGSGSGAGAGAAPAGALPKNGQVPPGTGGQISGKVIAANDAQPVGRILVQAWRMSRTGLVPVSSAATQADGTYNLAGLFPTSYYIEFSASGYVPQWYPASPSQDGGQTVTAIAQGTTQNVNATITGLPASISGNVNPGDTLTQVTTKVTAQPLLGKSSPTVVFTDSAEHYNLSSLPAPGTYQLTFETPGYTTTSIIDSVGGGDNRLEPMVILGASTGQISGTVRDGPTPLGGAMVSTTVNGKPLNVITPTTGQVGLYVLGNLTTPATYVITFTAPGHGTTTKIVDLTAGQSQASVDVTISSGTGSVTGRVVDDHVPPNGIGGATVTVGGAAVTAGGAAPSTTTLTQGSGGSSVGSFAINGLAAPGTYTLTVTIPGFAPTTVPITLSGNGTPPSVTIVVSTQLGGIKGNVTLGAVPFGGATVSATNDRQTFTATSNTSDGGYLIPNLQPGSYSVTVTAAGHRQQTALVTVTAGQTFNQPLGLA